MDHARLPRRAAAILLAVAAVADVGIACFLAAHGEVVRGVAYAVLGWTAIAAVLLLVRRAPGPGVLVVGALAMTAVVVGPIPGPPFALLPFAVAVVIAMVAGARVWALGAVGAAYLVPLALVFTSDSPVVAARGFGTMVVLLVGLGAGAFLRARSHRVAEEARRRQEAQRIAVEQERVRIARDLHDVLAHSLSSISVQAGVGLHLAAHRPEAAVEALETIRGASREALDEVRAVLGVLRGVEAAPTAPGPDLDAVAALVEDARRAGGRIDLQDGLQPRPSRPVQLGLFRIVQESLTNARRHAPGAAVEIVLTREGGSVAVRIRDRRAGTAPAEPVPGNGLTGMRERAASLGGSLTVTTHDDGLEVVARIPEVP